jgi:hypothetical protein
MNSGCYDNEIFLSRSLALPIGRSKRKRPSESSTVARTLRKQELDFSDAITKIKLRAVLSSASTTHVALANLVMLLLCAIQNHLL